VALKKERLAFNQPGRRKTLAAIVDCHFGLELTYENYWYQRAAEEYEVPDNASSAESYVESVSGFSLKMPGKRASSVTKNKQKPQKENELDKELKQQTAKSQELSLAIYMKEEELRSLQRLSLQFAHFHSYLLQSIERKRSSAAAVMTGFQDEVTWEDPVP
jgi:hypothetical protein